MNDARPASDQRLALALLEILDHYDTGGGLLVNDLQRRLPFYASTDEITTSQAAAARRLRLGPPLVHHHPPIP